MYDMKNLQHLATLKQQSKEAMSAFEALNTAVFSEGEIPLKYKELIAVAVAASKQCVYCLDIHKTNAKKAGATDAELSEATFVASAIGAGAALTHGTHLFTE